MARRAYGIQLDDDDRAVDIWRFVLLGDEARRRADDGSWQEVPGVRGSSHFGGFVDSPEPTRPECTLAFPDGTTEPLAHVSCVLDEVEQAFAALR